MLDYCGDICYNHDSDVDAAEEVKRMTIAVCDDDINQVNALKAILREWNSLVTIDEYSSAEQFLFCYPDHPCDLLLLDIEMGDMNGMELAHKLRENGDFLPIVFITGYSEFMQDGYDVEALHYLMKPVDRNKLLAVLDRCSQRSTANRAVFPAEDGSVCIDIFNIVYLEAFGKKTQITLKDGSKEMCACGLSAAAEKLNSDFISCHRSYLVNIRYIRNISRKEIVLDSGEAIPLSRRLYDSVNRAFIGFYKGTGL